MGHAQAIERRDRGVLARAKAGQAPGPEAQPQREPRQHERVDDDQQRDHEGAAHGVAGPADAGEQTGEAELDALGRHSGELTGSSGFAGERMNALHERWTHCWFDSLRAQGLIARHAAMR